ncbi:hypothetical protein AO741_11040 [Pseudomonas sp. TTU2014-105ASC]|nr:hypothetical protein AO741_11040 [Pseudomonas sp. TTU2014-105ASC]
MSATQRAQPAPAERQVVESASRRSLTSRELLGDQQELWIEHNGCRYCLRLTRQNKLILTK